LPTIFSHAAIGIAGRMSFVDRKIHPRLGTLSVICSILPDADVLAFHFGIPYEHFFGHRGFFHSLFFALLMGMLFTAILCRSIRIFDQKNRTFFYYFTLLAASHGILDAFTDGGLGIALFSPFDNYRYFFPITPLKVSPIGWQYFISPYGLSVLLNELLWIILPSCIIVVLWRFNRRIKLKQNNSTSTAKP